MWCFIFNALYGLYKSITWLTWNFKQFKLVNIRNYYDLKLGNKIVNGGIVGELCIRGISYICNINYNKRLRTEGLYLHKLGGIYLNNFYLN